MKLTYTTLRRTLQSAMFILLSGWTFFTFAQPVSNSPYARYGLGNLTNGSNIRSAGMGGLNVAMRADSIPYLVNFLNPASYTSIGFTAFDIGIYGNVTTISSSTAKENVNRAGLSYFAFGFPITKWWGGAFGLRQFSNINYSVSDVQENTDTATFGNTTYKFEGEGGTNQFFIGIGLKPFKNFSVGINASYLFGRMNHLQRLEFEDEHYFNIKTERYTDVGGFYLDYGIQYTLALKGSNVLTFGGTLAHEMKVHANSTNLASTYKVNTLGEDEPRDTILYKKVNDGSVQMPWKFGLGVTWRKGDKWTFGVEHTQELWSTYKDAFGKNDSLADAWKTSAGIEFRPSVPYTSRGFWAYFGKMHYRIGGHYAATQYKINGTQLSDYGITLGLGFPLRRTRAGANKYIQSMVNIAVEWGQRGTTKNSLLLEDYWNFKLGFTLNDRWFVKRKYE